MIPERLYDVHALETVAARKALGKHRLLGSRELRRACKLLGEPVAGPRVKLLRRLRELVITAALL